MTFITYLGKSKRSKYTSPSSYQVFLNVINIFTIAYTTLCTTLYTSCSNVKSKFIVGKQSYFYVLIDKELIFLNSSGASSSTQTLSQAGIAGMVIGLVGLLGVLAGVVWFQRHKFFPVRSNRSTDTNVAFARTMSTDGSIASSNSSGSEFAVQIRDMSPSPPQQ